MKKNIAIACVIALGFCFLAEHAKGCEDSGCATEMLLSDDSLRAYAKDALLGDPEKAFAIWKHFAMAKGQLSFGWLTVAAENGHKEAQAILSGQLESLATARRLKNGEHAGWSVACRSVFWHMAYKGSISPEDKMICEEAFDAESLKHIASWNLDMRILESPPSAEKK